MSWMFLQTGVMHKLYVGVLCQHSSDGHAIGAVTIHAAGKGSQPPKDKP